ncbi:hypothetical protein [Streptomyces physcomitrii]|uniref:Lipoprotein n=1 Tax=Streptomyces physcomitrii TaxID=2724184 RepID=A0ABX1H139_9ACTN|nr:hypothetical protein [Streptomyces physcomitrii]NKI41733.1 hypothetical protein [Streptomyces physcomitrii]
MLLVAAGLALTAGCSSAGTSENSSGHEPKSRSVQAVESEIAKLSSTVRDTLRIKARATESGPYADRCESAGEESGKLYRVTHPWSAYGVGNEVLEQGMAHLREDLPRRGWKVVKVGEDGSRNKNMQILAVHLRTRSQAEITWLKGLDGHEALIEVDVYSRCFRSERGPDEE